MNKVKLPITKLRPTEDAHQYLAFQILKQALADIKHASLPTSSFQEQYWGRQAQAWVKLHKGTFNLFLQAADLEPFNVHPLNAYNWSLKQVDKARSGGLIEFVFV